jgi:hypothetical protein
LAGRRLEPRGGVTTSTHPEPNVDVACDEGLALQMCWLYGMAEKRFQGRAGRLIATLGRERAARKTLRVASLDVGGGTTDLAIADYWQAENAIGSVFEMKQLFHDGVSVGGDEIGRVLLEQVVFPAIVEQMQIPPAEWNRRFSLLEADQGSWVVFRRRLVPMLWEPLVHAILARMEGSGSIDDTIGNILLRQSTQTLERLNAELKAVREESGKGSVLDVRLKVGERHLLRVVRRAMDRALGQYCDIVSQFGCDVLLLGGRPTSLSAVRRIIEEAVPIPPGNVIVLGDEAVGDWYPFIENGRIGDSKTCGVMGAAVAFMAQHGQGNFVVRNLDAIHRVPTILGVMNPSKADQKIDPGLELFQGGETLSRPVNLEIQYLVIGTQRMQGAGAVAKPTYRLQRDPAIQKYLEQTAVKHPASLVVRLERDPEYGDVISRVAEVHGTLTYVDGSGKQRQLVDDPKSVVVRLRTMLQDDFWLDSGRFDQLPQPDGGIR